MKSALGSPPSAEECLNTQVVDAARRELLLLVKTGKKQLAVAMGGEVGLAAEGDEEFFELHSIGCNKLVANDWPGE